MVGTGIVAPPRIVGAADQRLDDVDSLALFNSILWKILPYLGGFFQEKGVRRTVSSASLRCRVEEYPQPS
jgi:hypothetical protein